MNSIDNDAINVLGINEKLWKEFRGMTDKYIQDDLPGMLEAETEAKQASIDKETACRRKEALTRKWFGYYRKCKDPEKKFKLIDQYNFLAQSRGR